MSADCDCCPPPPPPPLAPQAVTPPPSGNTKTQSLMHGSSHDKNGQPIAKPVGVTPGGALKVSLESVGFTGGYVFQEGDLLSWEKGLFQGAYRNGVLLLPVGGGMDTPR